MDRKWRTHEAKAEEGRTFKPRHEEEELLFLVIQHFLNKGPEVLNVGHLVLVIEIPGRVLGMPLQVVRVNLTLATRDQSIDFVWEED